MSKKVWDHLNEEPNFLTHNHRSTHREKMLRLFDSFVNSGVLFSCLRVSQSSQLRGTHIYLCIMFAFLYFIFILPLLRNVSLGQRIIQCSKTKPRRSETVFVCHQNVCSRRPGGLFWIQNCKITTYDCKLPVGLVGLQKGHCGQMSKDDHHASCLSLVGFDFNVCILRGFQTSES